MATASTVILGTGSYAPARILTNADLATMVDTSDEWIFSRSGIRERHIAAPGEATSDMAVAAAKSALADAKLTAADIDLLIVATVTPDQTVPAVSCTIQHKLGVPTHAACFDLNAACSGFVYALDTACAMLGSGRYRRALVIGVEKLSSIVDWKDRTTCVLFGDGAGAIVLEARETVNPQAPGILATRLHADGAHNQLLFVDGGVSTTGTVGHLRMKGKEVFRHAVTNLAGVVGEVLAESGHVQSDIDWLVPHQANARILDATAKKLSLSPDKVVTTVDRHANTSAASVPLALDVAMRDGRLQPGQLVVLEAMGGGFTWGACLLRL